MRIHFTKQSDEPKLIAVRALEECRRAGTIAEHVTFKTLTVHRGGPGHTFALEVQLEAWHRDRGRRRGNSGSYGMGDNYAATYDEWGFFLAAMYREDHGAKCNPNFKHGMATYQNSADFHHLTGHTYDPTYPQFIEDFGDIYPYRAGRNQIGRRGAGRVHVDAPSHLTNYAAHDPRSAEWLADLQQGKAF